MIKVLTFKSILCFITILTLMLSFPIQVFTSSPLPSLLPYIFISILFTLSFIYKKNSKINVVNNKNTDQLILIYFIFVVFHTTWQTMFAFISIQNGISAIIVYGLPIIFYLYFNKYASDKELHAVLMSIAVAGLISGIYFVYDSYYLFINQTVSDYSKKILNYSMMRRPGQEDHNLSRVTAWGRPHGLLEKHAISSAWSSLSCFALISILPRRHTKIRSFILYSFFFILAISLNFTAIGAFVFIIIFMEFKLYFLFKGIVSRNFFMIFGITIILLPMVVFIFFEYFPELADMLFLTTSDQVKLALGIRKTGDGSTLFGNFFLGYINYPIKMLSFPLGFLIGDGFSNWGVIPKGGDYGHVELLHRLGFPLYFVVLYALLKMIKLSIKKIYFYRLEIKKYRQFLEFAVYATMYFLITTIHYSTMESKSTMPIFFICIAIFSKYLPLYSIKENN